MSAPDSGTPSLVRTLPMLFWVGAWSLAGLCACTPSEAPPTLPRCEPDSELLLERALKRAYRHLARNEREAARDILEPLLTRHENHPEILAGIRWIDTIDASDDTANSATQGTIIMGGKGQNVSFPVETQRFRFEEMRRQHEVAQSLGLSSAPSPGQSQYSHRGRPGTMQGADVPMETMLEHIDLIVLHDTENVDTRSAFLTMLSDGESSHFTVDFDGTIYQHLDLAHSAKHCSASSVEVRSIAVHLVNPVSLDRPPLPTDAKQSIERLPSPPVELHGQKVSHWGYTALQQEGLIRLLKALSRLLPGIPDHDVHTSNHLIGRTALPGPIEARQGIMGHLHLESSATDPGAGFDWRWLQRRLR